MKKLKPWQIALLVIFYPIGIIYLVIWLINKKKQPAAVSIDTSKMEIISDFHTKVVGVTFNNDDGTSRQKIIQSCKSGEDIILKPTPSKEYPDAIGVFNTRGQQLGNINADLAKRIKDNYFTNPIKCNISALTGGGEHTYGCNLHIVIYKN